MKRILLGAGLAGLLAWKAAIAHEGHSLPGAMPPAPHGGTVVETESPAEGETEAHPLFVEAVHKGKDLKLYVLTLPEGATTFQTVPASSAEKPAVTVEIPRRKGTQSVAVTPKEDHLAGTFDARGSHRFVADVRFQYRGKPRSAKLSVEKR